jgi:hypothetical protein
MRVEGEVEIFQDLYKGSAKAGPYAAGNVKAKDGEFDYWLPVFITGNAYKAMADAPHGSKFSVVGVLVQNTRKKDGETIRTIQLKITRATKAGSDLDDEREW